MVRSAKNWPWSSYRATAGFVEAPSFLAVDAILELLARNRTRARTAYRDFVKGGRGVEVWDELRGGILLGSDEFVAELKPLLSDFESLKEFPRRQRLTARPSLARLFAKVRDKSARDERIHEALRVHGYTLQEVADVAGLHYSTVSRIAKAVEAQEQR
jgi:hypothetical protein